MRLPACSTEIEDQIVRNIFSFIFPRARSRAGDCHPFSLARAVVGGNGHSVVVSRDNPPLMKADDAGALALRRKPARS